MYKLIFIILFLIILFIILYFLPIKIYIKVKKNTESYKITIHFKTLFGIVRYQVRTSFINRLLKKNKNKFQSSEGTLPLKDLIKDLRNIYEHFYLYYDKFSNIFDYLKTRIIIREFLWITEWGTGDAAVTGMFSGVFWALKGFFVSMMQKYFCCEKTTIHIDTKFNKKIFNTTMDCIIHIKMGHIINISFKFGYILLKKSILKGGEQDGRSSNRSINENNYG